MRLGWGLSSAPDAVQQECCEPGSTLLCMGLFSRFFVQALPCTAEGTQCRVRDTTSLVPRVYGTNRSNSNTSCSSNDGPTKNGRDCSRPFSLSDALPSRRRGAGRRGRQRGLSAVQERGDVAD